MTVHLKTLTFDGSGRGEKNEFFYRGHYEEKGSTCRLLWQREEEGVLTRTVLSFDKEDPTAVCMQQTGGCISSMHFTPGETKESLYAVPGAGEFLLTLQTERVENTLTRDGGRLHLAYEMHLGGERQRILLTLTAEVGEETPPLP